MVWEKLNRDVEQNISRQKERKELQRNQLKDKALMIDMVRARFQDDRTIDAVMRESAYRKIGAELQRFSEFAKTPERKAALDALMAQNNMALTEAAETRRRVMEDDVLKRRAIMAARTARPDPLAALVKRTGQYAQVAENVRKIEGKQAGDYEPVPAWNAQVPKSSAKEAREFTAKMERLRAAAADYRKLGPGSPGVDAAQSRMGRLLKEAGESSDTDLAERMKILPDPSNPNFDKRMDQFEKTLRDDETAFKKSLGVAPTFTPTTEKK